MNKLQATSAPFVIKKSENHFNLNTLLLLESVAVVILNIFLWIFIVAVKDLRKTRQCHYLLNLLFINITLAIVTFENGDTPSKSFFYGKDTLLICICNAKHVEIRNRCKEIKYPSINIKTKDMVTIISSVIWAPPLILLCLVLISEISVFVWMIIYTALITIILFTLSVYGFYLFFLSLRYKKPNCKQLVSKSKTIITFFNVKNEKETASAVYLATSISFVALILPSVVYNYLLLCNVVTYDCNIARIVYQVALVSSLLDPIFYFKLSKVICLATKKLRRNMDTEMKELDRKNARHLLTRDRFSGSI